MTTLAGEAKMVSHDELAPQELERQFLENMRSLYEGDGYTFVVAPSSAVLPDFLGSYVPDAVAQKPGENIAIEVKRRQSSSASVSLKRLRDLFAGHPEWQFRVVYSGEGPTGDLTLSNESSADLLREAEGVERLSKEGERRAAFILAWALLEASLRSTAGELSAKARTPGTVVQTLTMLGHLDEDRAARLRPLIDLRNRVVHGGFDQDVAQGDVDAVLGAVREVLADRSPVH